MRIADRTSGSGGAGHQSGAPTTAAPVARRERPTVRGRGVEQEYATVVGVALARRMKAGVDHRGERVEHPHDHLP